MTPIYKFSLQKGSDSTTRVIANPIYKDNLSVKYEKESGEMFFRRKIDGKLTFVRNDYDYVMTSYFDEEFRVIIDKSTDNGKTWQEYYVGKFFRTDCTINETDKSITVQPTVIDNYTQILDGIENEYNLMTLAPKIERFVQYVRPVLQFYIEGTDKVQNYIGGMYFEQDAVQAEIGDVLGKYHFGVCGTDEISASIFTTAAKPNYQQLNGTYRGRLSQFNETEAIAFLEPDTPNGYHLIYRYKYNGRETIQMTRISTGAVVTYVSEYSWGALQIDIKLNPNDDPVRFNCTYSSITKVFARLMLNVPTFRGQATYPIDVDDIVEDNKNYNYVIGASFASITITTNESTEPTEWGLKDNGKYYQVPNTLYKYYPVARSLWTDKSYWFYDRGDFNILEESGRAVKIMPDTYTLESVITVLLNQFAPNLSFTHNLNNSQFLFGNVRGHDWHIFMTPKSNVLAGDYTTPAQKAPITLRSIFEMLKKAYGLYWHIEGNMLRIEHLQYYKNGGSYQQEPQISYNLNTLKNPRNGKELSFATSEYSFNKSAMTARYEYDWMDESSEPFAGGAIEVLAPYVQKNKKEKVTIGEFTSDVDLMNINPSAIAMEGFAVFETILVDNQWRVPILGVQSGRWTYYLNNGYLSMYYLQPNFLTYDMASEDIKINGESATAKGVMRCKEQTINFPCGDNDPDPLKLIRTHLGAGQIKTLQINLTSRNAKTTLMYETV